MDDPHVGPAQRDKGDAVCRQQSYPGVIRFGVIHNDAIRSVGADHLAQGGDARIANVHQFGLNRIIRALQPTVHPKQQRRRADVTCFRIIRRTKNRQQRHGAPGAQAQPIKVARITQTFGSVTHAGHGIGTGLVAILQRPRDRGDRQAKVFCDIPHGDGSGLVRSVKGLSHEGTPGKDATGQGTNWKFSRANAQIGIKAGATRNSYRNLLRGRSTDVRKLGIQISDKTYYVILWILELDLWAGFRQTAPKSPQHEAFHV